MKLYAEDIIAGMEEMFSLYKQGNNIFDMKGGALFPHNTTQKTWEYAQDNGTIHLSDGMNSYSFKGNLADYDSELEKMPEAPLPDVFKNAKSKHKAQVHRSDPGSIYFTLQEGHNNPTYTLKHMGDNKWKAIPKPKKVKDMLKQPITPHNVNLEAVKEGMLNELENYKQADWGAVDKGVGSVLQDAINFVPNLMMLPAKMTGAVTNYGDPNPTASEPLTSSVGNAALAGGIGALGGGAYHLAKRHLLNTPEENQQEDAEGGHALKRILAPAAGMAGLNFAGRQIMPSAVNNPETRAFPA